LIYTVLKKFKLDWKKSASCTWENLHCAVANAV
jgi:hypothetical protein